MFERLLSYFSKDLAMDLGTANTLIYLRGRGVVLNEPSVVAINQDTHQVIAVGQEARNIIGRHSQRVVTIRPLKDGVIADFEVTAVMIKYFLSKVLKRRQFVRPRLVVAVPTGITSVEKRAVIEAAEQAGARHIHLVEEPMAAAIGTGLPVDQPFGNMIVDIGGGTTEVAVISMFAVAYSESVRVAGDEANEAILRYMQRERQMIISEVLAENIKMKIGTAAPLDQPETLEVTGKEILTGIPRTFTVTDEEIREAIKEPVYAIVEAVKRALEKTPPDLAADIHDKGFWLAGGGALLRGLDRLLSQYTTLKVNIAEDPLTAVARGAGTVIEHLDFHRSVFIN
ncbi:rod shape-determining protein [Syntrophobacter fumaroxidans]|uniref:Cell shape-determining protein MreB n=1 Tax=Syntrophobacter fumaroxidans (strain DSM 10017 / MPOB) TaxID=335543 RepID=A0LJK0_SYNFM|nr:rod shape-determining protein [Syntrophobacter fumaroxidans]ABK17602.1 rod shape-determining protein MreB [Syntrophobacter fumaroxidans MPOB]